MASSAHFAIESVATQSGNITMDLAAGHGLFVGSVIQIVEHSNVSLNNKTARVTNVTLNKITTDLAVSVTAGAGGYVHAVSGGQSGSGIKVYNGV